MKSVRTIASVLIAALWAGLGACSETFDTKYKSYREAVAAGAVAAGWVPNWLPEEAGEILEVHNIDTNAVMLRFNYPKAGQVRLPSNCSRITTTEVRAPPFKRSWWPADVPETNVSTSKHGYWKCAGQYVAILANQQQGLVWSPN